MKIKTVLMILPVALLLALAGCTDKKGVAQAAPISVDSLMISAEAFLGDTIVVEGTCSHLCKHGGRKAFLTGADTALVLRCESTPEMGGAFAPDCVGKTIAVRGIVREKRIDEAAVARMEAQYLAADSAAQSHEACDTEKKAQGQAELSSFEARMTDYRTKIAARAEAEAKPYLSFYYIEAIGYKKLND